MVKTAHNGIVKKHRLVRLIICLAGIFILYSPGFCQDQQVNHGEYTVGMGDVMEINILQPEKLTTTVTVSPDGSITFPYLGNIKVQGLTLTAIQEQIQDKLSDGYMKYPAVSVTMKETHSKKVFVYGQVNHPGAYSLDEPTSVLRAISLAGGFRGLGISSLVKVLRPKKGGGYLTIEQNLEKLMGEAGEQAVMLEPGDTIIVSEAKYSVFGQVNRPGVYSLEGPTNLLRAISAAGGFSSSLTSRRVRIMRQKQQGGGCQTIEPNISKIAGESTGEEVMIEPEDTIIVSESRYFVFGQVNRPGAYPLEEKTTVLKAVTSSGGFTNNAYPEKIKVLRQKKNDLGYIRKEVNLKGVIAGNSDSDFFLEPEDTVVVGDSRIFVYGEVNHPGIFPLQEGPTVLKAISIAGGFTKFGAASRVKVLRKVTDTSSESIKVNVKAIIDGTQEDMPLEPGDTVMILEGVF